jgi:hypothetical protein
MRIFVKDGEEVITRFPSKHLKGNIKINVILPDGYEQNNGRYDAVYIISKESFDKNRAKNLFSNSRAFSNLIFISININGIDYSGRLYPFLTEEILPFIDLNYKTKTDAQSRIIAASEGVAAEALGFFADENGYFLKLALLFQGATPMPQFHVNPSGGVSIFAAGTFGNMARIQTMLEEKGLKFIENFAYKILESNDEQILWQEINFDFLLSGIKDRKAVSLKFYTSSDSLSIERLDTVDMRLDIKTSGGYRINYIPKNLKIAPPFLNWEADKGELNIIPGATPSKVKISARPYFYNKDVKISLKVK